MRIRILSLFAAGILLMACGDDKSSTSNNDTTPPSAISDLACIDSVGDQIVLTWTSTGNDGDVGQAAGYDLRFAFEPITEGNWAQAIAITATPVPPQPAGGSEEATTNDITWWERTYFAIKARDSAGNWSALSNVGTAIPQPDANLRLITRTQHGAYVIEFDGDTTKFATSAGYVEVVGSDVYFGGGHTLARFSTAGVPAGTITLPDTVTYLNFCALPNGRFALLDNNRDVIHFVDAQGNWLGEVLMFDEPGPDLQNVDGVVVGNQLIISETGTSHLLGIDLLTLAISDFKDLTTLGGWLGGIDYYRGEFFLTQSNSIRRFTAVGDPELVATFDVYNVVGIVVAGGYSFVAVNFANAVYRVNIRTGEIEPLATGLDYPQDIELLRL